MMGCSCGGNPIPIEPQYGYCMNSYLNGDAWNYVPAKYKTSIDKVRNETQVKNPARVFNFSEENSWSIPELGSAQINDNNLRPWWSDPERLFQVGELFHRPFKAVAAQFQHVHIVSDLERLPDLLIHQNDGSTPSNED